MDGIADVIRGWWRGVLHRLVSRHGRAPSVVGGTDSEASRSLGHRTGQLLHYRLGRESGSVDLVTARKAAERGDGFVWIDIEAPTRSEIDDVAACFGLPALAVEDAVRAHQRPKLELYDGCLFAVIKPVTYVNPDEVVDVAELAVFVGTGFVVTVRHGVTEVPAKVRARFADTTLDAALRHGPSEVLYRVTDLVVDEYELAVLGITQDVDHIETHVFDGSDHDHSERIYKLKREVAEFRRAAVPLAQPLSKLATGEVAIIDADAAPYFRDVHDHLLRATDAIEAFDRLLSDVLQANLARVGVRQNAIAVRQNEDMRKISAWAAIALVPTAIAGIYGMNFDHMPELRWKYGYFLVLAVIATTCLGLHRLFRRNGWL